MAANMITRDPLPVLIEDRIKREDRRGRNVRTDNAKSLFFKQGSGDKVASQLESGEFAWQGAYFNEEKYLVSGDNTAVQRKSLTYNHTENGAGV